MEVIREKIFIWGGGQVANRILSASERNFVDLYDNELFVIEGIIDNDSSKWGTIFHGKTIVSPQEAINYGFDKVIVLIENEKDVIEQAEYGYKLDKGRVKGKLELLRLLFILKYQNSADTDIKMTIDYLKENDICLYSNWLPKRELKEIHWDGSINLPYVFFEDVLGKNRRMYFPWQINRDFVVKEGKQYYYDMGWEQQATSPHLYTYSEHDVREGDVVIDGGVCEGNFSLKYAPIVEKLYMFEPNSHWDKANYYTFQEFENKITRINRMLSKRTTDTTVAIDDLGIDRLDFLKLDVEGAELDTLIGSQRVLKDNNVNISVCTYHYREDAIQIRLFLESIGYKTEYSKGNMIFIFDQNIWNTFDIRKCMLYARK